MASDDWIVVYRGFAVPALDLVQTMLHAEGLEPRRLGNASPALIGVGDWAVEQRIEVPRQHEQAALALIAASQPASGEELQSTDLETEAMSGGRAISSDAAPRGRGGFSPLIIGLIVAAIVVLFFVLR